MSKKVVTFGEIMLRLSTPGFKRFVQAESFDVVYGGGEANVAAALAQLNLDSFFVTKVPDNPIGQAAINSLRRFGVNSSFIKKGGERLGIYFLETGASQRPSLVVYDRANSAIANALENDFNWQEIFMDASWFHFTGITPALSDNCVALVLQACKASKANGITVSCDLNYRKKLWTREKAKEVMTAIMPYVDVVIANEEDAENIFGIKSDSSDVDKGLLDTEGYKEIAKKLMERFDLKHVAITLRESYSASDNGWSGLLYDGNNYYHSHKYNIRIVDRVGGGDSFGAGLIYGLLQNWYPQEVIDFATAASCLKQTIHGDFNMVTVEEVQKLASGDGSGRVQR